MTIDRKIIWCFKNGTKGPVQWDYYNVTKNERDVLGAMKLMGKADSVKSGFVRMFRINRTAVVKANDVVVLKADEFGYAVLSGNMKVGCLYADDVCLAKQFENCSGKIKFIKDYCYVAFMNKDVVEQDISVVGSFYHNSAIESLLDDYADVTGFEIKFEDEPDNKFDKNAVKCVVSGRHIGYVSRDLAPAFTGKKVKGYVSSFQQIDSANYDIRAHVVVIK